MKSLRLNATTIHIFIFLITCVLFSGCEKETVDQPPAPTEEADCATVTYESDVRTIISANCAGSSCHGVGGRFGDFTTYAQLKPVLDNGVFERKVIDIRSMPVGRQLSVRDFEKIKCWAALGYPETASP